MDAIEALRAIKAESGKSGVQISADIGRSRSYVGTLLSQACPPQVDTLAAIADACGYDLQLRGRDRGDVIAIDPPRR